MIKLSDYVFKFIASQNVKHVFLLAGGGSMHLVDSLGKNTDIEYICCLHEQSCSFAAEAYAEYANHLGVSLVTTGPGGTNCITGVAAAWVESSSCLFISGQAKRSDLIAFTGVRSMGQQEIDIVSIVKPITKFAVTVMDPLKIKYYLEKAVYLAIHGRPGPVWIDIPLDVQAEMIDECSLESFDATKEIKEIVCKDIGKEVDKVVEIIRNSTRPVLLIGNGVRIGRAVASFLKLLGKIKIPVLLTWKAIDLLPEDHPLYRGRPGGIGQRAANFVQQNSDCLVIIGARLDMPSLAFDHEGFARKAIKIMVDIDCAEIKKMRTKIDVPLCIDAGIFIEELLKRCDRLKGYQVEEWIKITGEWYKKYPVVLPEYRKYDPHYVSTYYLVKILSQKLLASDLIVPGSSGGASDIFMQSFEVKSGQRVLNAPSLGAMGTGIPGAIGACLASGRKRTICVNGDGGFQLNIQELETVRRLNLPIKYFVLNNDGYGSIRSSQSSHFQGRVTAADSKTGVSLPNIKKIAYAYGIKSLTINDNSELRIGIKKVLSFDGPTICEVKVDPAEKISPRVMSRLLPDGTIVSSPMEDMSPLLNRSELKKNMLIKIH
jgi:acetolactate synthase-1/2/3 large subunit